MVGSRRSCGWWLLIEVGETGCVSTPLVRKSVGLPACYNSPSIIRGRRPNRRTQGEAWNVFLAESRVWYEAEQVLKLNAELANATY